ncbi:MAG: SDR family NAD(P)-dependent oxidoreductase, partial [Leptospira sp.]|nr:SDR family NAD(P)-dependent oxidoreductase [Leptospira sp.]
MPFSFLDNLLDKTVIFGYDRIGFHTRKKLWNPRELEVDLADKTALITGANSGLGYATAMALAKRKAVVHMVCRNKDLGESAQKKIMKESGSSKVHLHIVDLSLLSEVQKFANQFRQSNSKIDILINNAGVLLNAMEITSEAIEKSFATNLLGQHVLTMGLLPLLEKASHPRVILVSSGGMYAVPLRLEDPEYKNSPYEGVKAYAHAKRAQVVLTEIYAELWKGKNIGVYSMHPGWADTKGVQNSLPIFRMLTRAILRTSEEGADTIVYLAVSPNVSLDQSGTFWFDRKIRSTVKLESTRYDSEDKRKLWEM